MGKRKKKKQEAEKPDPFVSVGGQILAYSRGNLGTVIFLVVAILAVATFALYWPYYQNGLEVAAATRLLEGEKLLEAKGALAGLNFPQFGQEAPREDVDKALSIFDEVANKHSKTLAGKRALLSSGDQYLKLAAKGNKQEAIDYYAKARDAYDRAALGGRPAERYYALAGLGAACEGQEDFAAAVAAYKQIVDDGQMPNRDTATLDLARALRKDNRGTEATALLVAFETDFPDSSLKDYAAARLLLAQASGPVEATPAPTPAPTEEPAPEEESE